MTDFLFPGPVRVTGNFPACSVTDVGARMPSSKVDSFFDSFILCLAFQA